MIDKKEKSKIKSHLADIKHSVSIGKNGINDQVIASLKKRIKAHKYLKIKMLKNYNPKKSKNEIANEIANKLKADVIDIRGNCIGLYKNR